MKISGNQAWITSANEYWKIICEELDTHRPVHNSWRDEKKYYPAKKSFGKIHKLKKSFRKFPSGRFLPDFPCKKLDFPDVKTGFRTTFLRNGRTRNGLLQRQFRGARKWFKNPILRRSEKARRNKSVSKPVPHTSESPWCVCRQPRAPNRRHTQIRCQDAN